MHTCGAGVQVSAEIWANGSFSGEAAGATADDGASAHDFQVRLLHCNPALPIQSQTMADKSYLGYGYLDLYEKSPIPAWISVHCHAS